MMRVAIFVTEAVLLKDKVKIMFAQNMPVFAQNMPIFVHFHANIIYALFQNITTSVKQVITEFLNLITLFNCRNNFFPYGNNSSVCGNNFFPYGNNLSVCGNNSSAYGNNFFPYGNNSSVRGNNFFPYGNNLSMYGNNSFGYIKNKK
jgi:hypothetical protein